MSVSISNRHEFKNGQILESVNQSAAANTHKDYSVVKAATDWHDYCPAVKNKCSTNSKNIQFYNTSKGCVKSIKNIYFTQRTLKSTNTQSTHITFLIFSRKC